MSTLLRALLFPLVLSSCDASVGDASPQEAAREVLRAEKLFTEAYENLDAAIVERLLTDDFELRYAKETGGRSRTQYVAELAEMRAVFPTLRLEVDTVVVTAVGQHYEVSGERTFTWELAEGQGQHTERFTNYWRREDGEWRLYQIQIATTPAEDGG